MSILESKYKAVRSMSRSLAASLSAEDQMVQSCPEANPVKWHQAHTTWFFETFVLRPFLAGYKPFREEFYHLFNGIISYPGEEIPWKNLRASFSRPSLNEILALRAHVDYEMTRLFARSMDAEVSRRILLGLNHEQQHQELILTDIKHAFFSNPLHPSYKEAPLCSEFGQTTPTLAWHSVQGGLVEIGHAVNGEDPLDFYFDNETPCHRVYLEPFSIANREVTCREYLEFMSDDAYTRPELWLSDGWDTVRQEAWQAPLYWDHDPDDETGWRVFSLRGWHGLSILLDTPVCHISFFEADAFARWRGCRLPTEAEWEFVAAHELCTGNLLDTGRLHPAAAAGEAIQQFYGDCWEWTASACTSYTGYKPLRGALHESNEKFMPGQMVLRGGSCVTPADHMRATYRNFYKPGTRWQFAGIRLAA
ncbi:MAG TPA: ergothioneine biosynthesis protein EgtB [Acidobacteriaceae bacterium]|nr:ergothioneine biosynthesis protein EgtB [Acidobacteriaceae bacterium]